MNPSDDRTVYVDPADTDRTRLIPRPGGRASGPRVPPAAAATARTGSAATLQRLVAGINPLLGAASQLLALVSQLRATTAHADRAGLRRQLVERVADFEQRARASGVGKPQVAAARYLLCTFIDEAIAGTPWGAVPVPGVRTLLQEYHEDESGADKAFELLERLSTEPAVNAELLELFYVCLALGFEGRHAGRPDGAAQLRAWQERLLELLRPDGAPAAGGPRTLAQRWAGSTPARGPTLTVVPIWMALVVGAAVSVGALLWFTTRLSRGSDAVMQQLHAVAATLRVERASAPAARPRLAPLLVDDAAGGWFEVRDEPQRSLLVLPADRLFVAGTAQLDAAAAAPLARAAHALAAHAGRVEVIAHTDDRPIESLRFPSNWHLSRERAQAVQGALVRDGVAAERIRAEGRADAEPRAPNESEAARERNRRVEIQLLLPRPE